MVRAKFPEAAERVLSFHKATGVYLSRLAATYRDQVKRGPRATDARSWEINPG